jgi:hypothetical protein
VVARSYVSIVGVAGSSFGVGNRHADAGELFVDGVAAVAASATGDEMLGSAPGRRSIIRARLLRGQSSTLIFGLL